MCPRAIARCTALLQQEARLASRRPEYSSARLYDEQTALRTNRGITRHSRVYSDFSWAVDASEQGIHLSSSRRGKRGSESSYTEDTAAELKILTEQRDKELATQVAEGTSNRAVWQTWSGVALRDLTAADAIAASDQTRGGRASHTRVPDDGLVESSLSIKAAPEIDVQSIAQEAVSWKPQRAYSRTYLFELDYGGRFRGPGGALAHEEPDLAARCILAADYHSDITFLDQVTDEEFTKVLDLLRPERFLDELLGIHYYMSDQFVNNYGLESLESISAEYEDIMRGLLQARAKSRHDLRLEDYEIVLEAAQDLRLEVLARNVWAQLKGSGIAPSTRCFNGLAGALMYSKPLGAKSRHHDRVLYGNLKQESSGNEQAYFTSKMTHHGAQVMVNEILTDMQQNGMLPDALSYAHTITACALEGQIKAVEAILLQVFQIDAVGLQHASSQDRPPRAFDAEDTLHPTKQLLYAITRAYCINNDLSTAMRLLYYMSNHYKLPIDRKQWALMLEWAYVLSIRRSQRMTDAGKAEGQVDRLSVESIWRTMTSPPHNIKPTMGMYDYLIRAAFNDTHVRASNHAFGHDFALERMNDARRLYEELKDDRARRWDEFNGLLASREPEARSERSTEHAARRWELAQLNCIYAEHTMGKWWFYYLKATASYAISDYTAERTAEKLPQMVQLWAMFAASGTVEYDMPTGHVELKYKDETWRAKHNIELQRRAIAQEEALRQVPRLIDDCWYTNHSSYERCMWNGFPHNRPQELALHKSARGLRRPHMDVRELAAA